MSFNFFSHKNAFVVCKTTLKRLSKAPPFSKEYSILEYLMSSFRHFLYDQIRKVNYEILISLNKNLLLKLKFSVQYKLDLFLF